MNLNALRALFDYLDVGLAHRRPKHACEWASNPNFHSSGSKEVFVEISPRKRVEIDQVAEKKTKTAA